MADPQHQRLRSLFDRALALPREERSALLAGECAGDAALKKRLEVMLAAAEGEQFLAGPTALEIEGLSGGASDSAAELREGPGTRIGPYKLLQQIGEGGFGVVFLAEQEKPVARKVALKIIKLGMDTRQVVARFEQERQALALMDHPHIARVIDAGATETGRPYFVMDLVKGDPIVEYCDKHNLPIDERLDLFAQVCGAVQHAHSKGIIHRDLKPSNILVATQDGRPQAKVIDFGIAKATSAKLTDKTLFTEHQQVIGTLQYMSPEQAEGSLDLDTRTDVYALGVVLYELLTGSTPFDAKTLRDAFYSEVQRMIREVEPPKPSTRLSNSADALASIAACRRVEPRRLGVLVRGELDWIVMKALEKDRARRYETANSFADDVRRYLAGEPVLAAPPSATYQVKKFVRRHRFGVLAASLVSVALLVGLTGTWWGMVEAQRGRAEAELQTRRADDARSDAERQRAEADKQRDQAETARAQTQRVADFQARMLRRVPPFEMGRDLATDLSARVRDAQKELDLSDEQRARALATFNGLLGGISMTDAARRIIDANVLTPSSESIAAEFGDDPLAQAALHQSVAKTFEDLGIYDKAKAEAQRELELRVEQQGPDHRDTLRARALVGKLSWQLGQLAESRQIFDEVTSELERVAGPEDPDTLIARVCQGLLLMSAGHNEEARVSLEKTLAVQERALGPDDVDVASTLENLGQSLVNLSKIEQAIPIFERALSIRRRRFGSEDVATLRVQQGLASAYERQRRFDDANRLRLEAIDTLERVQGASHPDTIAAIAALATMYKAQSRLDEALVQARRALTLRRTALGDAHPRTIDSISDVAQLCAELGRYAEAEPLFVEALERSTQTFGPDSPLTMNRVNNLAVAYWYQGKFSDVETLFRRVLEFHRRTSGEDRQETAFAMNNLATVLQRLGRLREAKPLYERALAIDLATLGADHHNTLGVQASLATMLFDEGEYADAEKGFRAVSEGRRRVSGEDHPVTLLNNQMLATTLRKLGREDEAEALYVDTLERQRRIMGRTHPETLDTLTALATLYADTARIDTSRPLFEELYAARRAAAEAPDATAGALDAYATLLLECPVLDLRDPARALACARQLNQITKGEDASFVGTLAQALFQTGDAAGAAETMRTALSKLSPDAPDRPRFESLLAEFEAARDKR